ncbi:MAG: STAS domain-containing protein, partial [Armatimonadetes bacterium]|nr:STAS domain-containing protein [Armatimonadota bacterium]
TTHIFVTDLLTYSDCQPFQDALLEALARQRHRIVVDLRASPFIDTAVLGDLALAVRQGPGGKSRLEVVAAPDSQPLRVLALTGLDSLITVTVAQHEKREPHLE